MGSGSSVQSSGGGPQQREPSDTSSVSSSKPVAAAKPIVSSPSDRNDNGGVKDGGGGGGGGGKTVITTNKVAPIIIKNCKEEFQHVTDFKEPLVYGRMADGMPEHALVRNQYFLVADTSGVEDTTGTLRTHNIPNVRRHKDFPSVWCMGQPSRDALASLMHGFKEDGCKDILLINLRGEPVVFVASGYDLVPYGPRHPDRLEDLVVLQDTSPAAITALEVQMRKECMDLAAFHDEQTFYFYQDTASEPHRVRMAYDDDMAVTSEVYSRLSFNNSGIRYLRLGLSVADSLYEDQIDAFIEMFKHVPGYFESGKKSGNVPTIAFTSHEGRVRGSLGMVMGALMLAHKLGFPSQASKQPFPINEKSPNFERGEFHAIQKLVAYLPNGLKIKHEVDCLIDQCANPYNIRTAANEAKQKLEGITEDYVVDGANLKQYLLNQCTTKLEVYFVLICLNAYLHNQYRCLFGMSFSQWMERQPEIYHLLSHIDISHTTVPPSLVTNGTRKLVADDYVGLDVLSSQMDVKASNFRRVPGLPVYGMAQPSREGLSCVVDHLLSSKQGHPLVLLINLREDAVVECNGATYSAREPGHLDTPLILPGTDAATVQEAEEALKREIKAHGGSLEVYTNTQGPPETKTFNSVLSPVDMVEQCQMQGKQLQYHRMPMSDDAAPQEKVFDELMGIVCRREEIYSDEDGPAFVFQCHTGKGRTTTAMAIAGLIICHQRGFPYGTKPGEEERVSLPNAVYTQGNYKIVHELVRRIPNGQQVKREVDFILNQCSETMTPMHYHAREVIFVTYNKMKKAKNEEERVMYKKRALDYLERYMYLILFNTYLHCERRNKWKLTFSTWMREVASKVGVYELLDTLAFHDFETVEEQGHWLKSRRKRWSLRTTHLPIRGNFV